MGELLEQTRKHRKLITIYITAAILDATTTSLSYYHSGTEVQELSPLLAPILPYLNSVEATIIMTLVMLPILLLLVYLTSTETHKNTGKYSIIAIATGKILASTNNLGVYLNHQTSFTMTPEQHITLILLTYLTLVTLVMYGGFKDIQNYSKKKKKKQQKLSELPQQDFS